MIYYIAAAILIFILYALVSRRKHYEDYVKRKEDDYRQFNGKRGGE